jgi:hypothetical protein
LVKDSGRGVLEQGPFIKENLPGEDGQPKNLMESARMHYEFCGELGIKRVYQSDFRYQPRFALFDAIGGEKRNPSYAKKKERVGGGEEDTLLIPSDIHLRQLPDMEDAINKALGGNTADMFKDFFNLPFAMANMILKELINVIPNLVGKIGSGVLKIATLGAYEGDEPTISIFDTKEESERLKKLLNNIMGAKVYLSIGPREHTDGNSFYSKMYSEKEIIFKETPGQFTKENELKVGRTYKR